MLTDEVELLQSPVALQLVQLVKRVQPGCGKTRRGSIFGEETAIGSRGLQSQEVEQWQLK